MSLPGPLRIFLAALLLLPAAANLEAAENHLDLESELFSDGPGNTGTTAAALSLSAPEPKIVAFSGEITSAVVDMVSRTLDANSLYTLTVSDIFLDARLPRGAKVFADVEATYLSQTQLTSVALQELFLDFNLAQAAYFRAGKQVLQWGRCYLWNPTDLINIERPRFIRKIGMREGAYGFKAHVPFGTSLNLYSFIDTGNAPDAQSAAGALKVEYLVGNLEMAFSGWGKKGYHPVWGMDFSTRIFGIDTLGEISVTRGENRPQIRIEDGQLALAKDDGRWLPRASLDFSRSFTVGNFKDRLTIMLEGYYDRSGYETNLLADPADYDFAQPGMDGFSPVTHGTQKDFMYQHGLYQPNLLSRGYAALFVTFGRFLLTDMALNLNYIQNLVDRSGVLSAGVTYTELNGFTFGLLANGYLGGTDCEYTLGGEKYDLQLTFGIAF